MHFLLTRCNSSPLLAAKTNLTPYLAKAYAEYSPIPLEAPVIKTTLPFSLSVK